MMTPMPGNEIVPNEIVLVRHGETEWSSSGQHTSFSDIPLTARGEDQARTLANRLTRDGADIVVNTLSDRDAAEIID